MKKIIISIALFGFMLVHVGMAHAATAHKSRRSLIVDKNLNIIKIINYAKEDIQPRVFLENEFGIELPYTESIERHYLSIKSSLNFKKNGVIYNQNQNAIVNLLSRLFYVFLKSLSGGN